MSVAANVLIHRDVYIFCSNPLFVFYVILALNDSVLKSKNNLSFMTHHVLFMKRSIRIIANVRFGSGKMFVEMY